MKLSISRGSAVAAAFVAIAAKVFLENALNAPTTHNGAWLCPLIAALLVLPWIACIDILRPRIARTGRRSLPLYAALLVILLLDAAENLTGIAQSAGYLSLDCLPPSVLALPVALALFWCLSRGGDAVGYAAMLWARLAPVLLILVAVMQFNRYRPEWLRPLLGSGWQAIVRGSVRTAGRIIPCSAVLLLAEDGEKQREDGPARMLLFAAGIGALLLIQYLMMTPTPMPATEWTNRLDSLLTNGRAPLYLQLPIISAWFAGLLHLLLCEGIALACLLQRLFPALDGRLCALAAAAALYLASGAQNLVAVSGALSPWLYIVAAALTALTAFTSNRKGDQRTCV